MDRDKDKKKDDDKGGLDRAAFKRAIGMIESSGGKYLDSKYSSAAGKYHFLYNLIKNDPDMKGVSKRDFMNNHTLQEKIMDKAIDGKLAGYVGYAAHAKNLKAQFNTSLSNTELAALTHFLGAGGVRKYLRDPRGYSVAGQVNQTPEQYLGNFRKHAQVKEEPIADKAPISKAFVSPEAAEAMQVKKDGVNIRQPQIRKDVPQGLQFKQNTQIDTSALPDAISNQPVEPNIIPLEQQVQGGTPSGLKVLGSMTDTNNYENGGLVEFNEGGTHEENPHGGIPMGTDNEGTPNTVEEGETKFGDYVFSNRFGMGGYSGKSKANSFADGGELENTSVDPPTKKKVVEDSRKFVTDWFGSNVTKARLAKNLDKTPFDVIKPVNKGLKAVKDAEVKFAEKTGAGDAEFKDGNITFYGEPTPSTSTHEFAHAMGVDNDLTKVIREKWGTPASAIQKKTGLPFKDAMKQEFNIDDSSFLGRGKLEKTIDHSRYLSSDGELYPRIMEMRRVLGVKPGQKINDAQIEELKQSENPLFKYYEPAQIKDMLNTLARVHKDSQHRVKKELGFKTPAEYRLS